MIMTKTSGSSVLQSFKGTRVVSATLALLGLMVLVFISSSSEIYSPDGVAMPPQAVAQTDDTLLSSTVTTTISKDSYVTATGTLDKDEEEWNSRRVEEEISTIRSEIGATKTTPGIRQTAKRHLRTNPVLGKDLRTTFDPKTTFKQIINTSPMVLFIKSSEPTSLYLKNLLSTEYDVSPEIAVVDLEKHFKGAELQRYIETHELGLRHYGSKKEGEQVHDELPYLFINGVSVINRDLEHDIKLLHTEGKLLDRFKSFAGGNVMFQKRDIPSNS